MKNLSKKILSILKKNLKTNHIINEIVKKIHDQGGRSFLVGGAVRDLLLGIPIKDLDIEVHNISSDKLEKILKSFGIVNLVGKFFGVYRLYGLDIDWSLPRTDSSGRKPKVVIDPFMNIVDSFRRRDLTINSMGIDLITFELIDPFNGQKDLKNKILRATDKNFFVEDPLRFYRVMQFIGRFEMQPNKELNKICKIMHIKNVSRERIEEEFKKLFLKSKRPSLGINWLRKVNRLKEILPEIYDLINVSQDSLWHPEGDVYEHTMQAIDIAAYSKKGKISYIKYDSDDEKLILIWAALCHDLGKKDTTRIVKGKIISYGHEQESEVLARKLMRRITRNTNLINSVCRLVRYHMQPSQFINNRAKSQAYKRLANKLAPYANLQMLSKLFLIDRLSRNPKKGKPLIGNVKDVTKFLQKVKNLNLLKSFEAPILYGRDLIDVVEPGPLLGKLIKRAYEIQIDEEIKDKNKLKRKVLEEI